MAATTAAYVFDSFGTTVPLVLVDGLNEAFFRYGVSHLGIAPERLEELYFMRQMNPKDPQFLRESGPGKVRLLESGLYEVSMYDDVQPTFEEVNGRYANTVIFSKGAARLVETFYRKAGIDHLVNDVISTSENFPVDDKTKPACYDALRERLEAGNKGMKCYVSDEVGEVNACQEALTCDVFYIDRGQKRTQPIAERVREIQSLREIF